MDDYIVQQVVKVLSERIREHGSIPLVRVPVELAMLGLSRDLYNGLGPKRWLQQYFANEFIIEGCNGAEVVMLANPSVDEHQEVVYGCN